MEKFSKVISISELSAVTSSMYACLKLKLHKYRAANKTETSGTRPVSASAQRSLEKMAPSRSSNELFLYSRMTGYHFLLKAYSFRKVS